MIYFLIGFMGCGKSTKAKQLAAKLNCPVIDLDDEIVKSAGMSINEYFDLHGESGFRALEKETLNGFQYPETCVVATGGGLPCNSDNMQWMNNKGYTIYLKMAAPQLVSRLAKRHKRPLIKDLDDEQLLVFIQDKLVVREPFYNQAHLIVNAFSLDGEILKNEIDANPLG